METAWVQKDFENAKIKTEKDEANKIELFFSFLKYLNSSRIKKKNTLAAIDVNSAEKIFNRTTSSPAIGSIENTLHNSVNNG